MVFEKFGTNKNVFLFFSFLLRKFPLLISLPLSQLFLKHARAILISSLAYYRSYSYTITCILISYFVFFSLLYSSTSTSLLSSSSVLSSYLLPDTLICTSSHASLLSDKIYLLAYSWSSYNTKHLTLHYFKLN